MQSFMAALGILDARRPAVRAYWPLASGSWCFFWKMTAKSVKMCEPCAMLAPRSLLRALPSKEHSPQRPSSLYLRTMPLTTSSIHVVPLLGSPWRRTSSTGRRSSLRSGTGSSNSSPCSAVAPDVFAVTFAAPLAFAAAPGRCAGPFLVFEPPAAWKATPAKTTTPITTAASNGSRHPSGFSSPWPRRPISARMHRPGPRA
mmetsp:Transcript_104953/g.338443  ORF Transcript_104953/g.338443 Transcript_104953/m.338443 type:complete len:201 (-) Transcript_104953:3-605(-)